MRFGVLRNGPKCSSVIIRKGAERRRRSASETWQQAFKLKRDKNSEIAVFVANHPMETTIFVAKGHFQDIVFVASSKIRSSCSYATRDCLPPRWATRAVQSAPRAAEREPEHRGTVQISSFWNFAHFKSLIDWNFAHFAIDFHWNFAHHSEYRESYPQAGAQNAEA